MVNTGLIQAQIEGVPCYLNFSDKECMLYVMKFLMMQWEWCSVFLISAIYRTP